MRLTALILKIFIFIASFFVSIIALILPWSLRKIYHNLIHSASSILLNSTFIMNLINEHAFSNESDHDILLRTD